MKIAPIKNYIFNAASKTITFSDYRKIDLASILIITNVSTNTIIYNFAISGKGGTVSNNVLTLQFDTTSMNNTDSLQIYYDDPARDLTINNEGELRVKSEDNIAMLNRILTSLLPLTNTDSSQRTLQTLDSISAGVTLPTLTTVTGVTTVNTVTTVGSVTNITNALPTGANTIGSIASLVNPLPAGTNAIGSIVGINNALPTGANTIGDITIGGNGVGVGYDLYMMTLRSNYNTAMLG